VLAHERELTTVIQCSGIVRGAAAVPTAELVLEVLNYATSTAEIICRFVHGLFKKNLWIF
jgi:hypothetical protein